MDVVERMDRRKNCHGAAALLAAIIFGVGGCKSSGTGPHATTAPSAPISNVDECASRMHDIEGAMLFYFAFNNRLPDTLEQLNKSPVMGKTLDMECPVSHKPYIYRPTGIYMPERGERIILYDPAPSHSGMRWAISVQEPVAGKPLVAKVIALPESFFLLRPPK